MSTNPKDVVFWNAYCASPSKHELPSIIYRTIGAYKVAHAVRAKGFSAQVIDFATLFSEEELYQATVRFVDRNTTCLAISTTFLLDDWSISRQTLDPKLKRVINRVLDEYPNLKLVFGGYGIGNLKKHVHELNKDRVFFISQYGEDIIVDVVRFLKNGGPSPKFDVELDPTGRVKILTCHAPIRPSFNIECDRFRFAKEDCIQPGESLPIELSRGCVFKCKFCNHLMLGRGKLDYLKSMELVKEELIYNYENWSVTNYYVLCDTFNDTEYKMKEWHKMVMSLPFKIQFTSYLRADLLDRFPDVPYMLKESGLVSAYHGIETLGKESSLLIGKAWSGKHARTYVPKLYHDIWGGDVYQTVSLIGGLPGDTKADLIDMAKWFRENDLYNVRYHPLGLSTNLTAKNASEFERDAEKYGYTLNQNATKRSDWAWKNEYWGTDKELKKFLREEVMPLFDPHSLTMFVSWAIISVLQYSRTAHNIKITVDSFRKENLHELAMLDQPNIHGDMPPSPYLSVSAHRWLAGYKKSIMMA